MFIAPFSIFILNIKELLLLFVFVLDLRVIYCVFRILVLSELAWLDFNAISEFSLRLLLCFGCKRDSSICFIFLSFDEAADCDSEEAGHENDDNNDCNL